MVIVNILLVILSLIAPTVFAHDHSQHAKHNMVLFGESEIYVSHIVYKVPHNYQVILQVTFDPATLKAYLEAKKQFPNRQFIYFLDSMLIDQIQHADSISGTILYEDEAGSRHPILTGVKVLKENFRIIFFDEVPLDLRGKS